MLDFLCHSYNFMSSHEHFSYFWIYFASQFGYVKRPKIFKRIESLLPNQLLLLLDLSLEILLVIPINLARFRHHNDLL